MHVAFWLHLVPHSFHLCQVNCGFELCAGSLVLICLATNVAALKTVLFKYVRAKLFPFHLNYSLSHLCSLISLAPWTLNSHHHPSHPQTKLLIESSIDIHATRILP